MRVAVTGASGFLGRYVCAALAAESISYVSLGRAGPPSGGEHRSVDLLSGEGLAEAFDGLGATHLIHLAWVTEHGQFWSSQLNYAWSSATVKLVDEFVRAGGEHVLIAGTCAEYDWRYGFCREDLTPTTPATLYGMVKHQTHLECRTNCERQGVRMGWTRVFFPYGPGEGEKRLIPSLFAAMRGERPPFGVNRLAYRDMLHASDLANAFVLCAREGFDGVINVSSGRPTALEDVVRCVAQITGADSEVILSLAPSMMDSTRLLVGDCTVLESLGWSPKVSLNAGLLDY